MLAAVAAQMGQKLARGRAAEAGCGNEDERTGTDYRHMGVVTHRIEAIEPLDRIRDDRVRRTLHQHERMAISRLATEPFAGCDAACTTAVLDQHTSPTTEVIRDPVRQDARSYIGRPAGHEADGQGHGTFGLPSLGGLGGCGTPASREQRNTQDNPSRHHRLVSIRFEGSRRTVTPTLSIREAPRQRAPAASRRIDARRHRAPLMRCRSQGSGSGPPPRGCRGRPRRWIRVPRSVPDR